MHKQFLLEQDFRIPASKIEDLKKDLVELLGKTPVEDEDRPEDLFDDIAGEYGFEFEWAESDELSIDGINGLDNYDHPKQMEFLNVLGRHAQPGSYITAMGEDLDFWQWYFDFGQVFTRFVKMAGVITPEEDELRKKNGLSPKIGYRVCGQSECIDLAFGAPGAMCEKHRTKLRESGYSHCRCRDCFEIVIVSDIETHLKGEATDDQAFCGWCKKHGCPEYQGQRGMDQSCRRPDAYGPIDCEQCGHADYVWYDDDKDQWRCDHCEGTLVYVKRTD